MTVFLVFEVTSTASSKVFVNKSSSFIIGSAGSIAIIELPILSFIVKTPKVTAAAVSRPKGSYIIFSSLKLGIYLLKAFLYLIPVMIKIFSSLVIFKALDIVFSIKDLLSQIFKNCLCLFSLLNGQSLSPIPPAIIRTDFFIINAPYYF